MRKTIDIPIYGGRITFIKEDSLSEIKEEFNLNFKDDDYDAIVFDIEDDFYLATTTLRVDVIIHEIVHLVNNIFLSRNIELDRVNDEPQAYFAGWIAKEFNNFTNEL